MLQLLTIQTYLPPPFTHHTRVVYKVCGPEKPLNFELTVEERAVLDAMSLEQLMAQFRAAGAAARIGGSGYHGVSWDRDAGRTAGFWRARWKHKTIRVFQSAEEAARAYDAVAREVYGRYAATRLVHQRLYLPSDTVCCSNLALAYVLSSYAACEFAGGS